MTTPVACPAAGHAGADGAGGGVGDATSRDPDQSDLDGVDGQRGGDGVSGGAVPGRGVRELCAGREHDTASYATGADRGDELQLPGAGGGCGGESERLFDRGDGDDVDAAGHGGADGAGERGGDGGVEQPDQPGVDGLDGQRGGDGVRVERCQGPVCANFAEVGTRRPASYSDTGLAGATSYSYRVRAADAAGNLSGYSTVQTARRR